VEQEKIESKTRKVGLPDVTPPNSQKGRKVEQNTAHLKRLKLEKKTGQKGKKKKKREKNG